MWFVVFTLGTTEGVGAGLWPTLLWTAPLSALVALVAYRPLGRLIDAAVLKVRARRSGS
jgi:hypothetical protein